ncbi:hypothetical protein AKJ09_01878 [Labilithrix luteola]|uniref:Uncharacterized protein n=1 Tax=Labilithrix luteola TaxID=1391654 RepID=A0A0K1PQ40_9BACT|nr:hypothetical protein AKJ09_01878 [Labilithrix luteola]
MPEKFSFLHEAVVIGSLSGEMAMSLALESASTRGASTPSRSRTR